MGFIPEGNDDVPQCHNDVLELGIIAEVEMALISNSSGSRSRGSGCSSGAPSEGVTGGGVEEEEEEEQVKGKVSARA